MKFSFCQFPFKKNLVQTSKTSVDLSALEMKGLRLNISTMELDIKG
jgi:hypothetical protein